MTGTAEARTASRLREWHLVGRLYWAVVAVATVFTLARFSGAFLILRAEEAGLPLMLIPQALVGMNAVPALSDWARGRIVRAAEPPRNADGQARPADRGRLALAPGLPGPGYPLVFQHYPNQPASYRSASIQSAPSAGCPAEPPCRCNRSPVRPTGGTRSAALSHPQRRQLGVHAAFGALDLAPAPPFPTHRLEAVRCALR